MSRESIAADTSMLLYGVVFENRRTGEVLHPLDVTVVMDDGQPHGYLVAGVPSPLHPDEVRATRLEEPPTPEQLEAVKSAFLSWLDRQHDELAKTSPGVCECGSLLAPDGTCGVRPSTHEAMLAWAEDES